MSKPATILTKFLVISDTHNFQLEEAPTEVSPLRLPLPRVDVVLHCGDLTHCGGLASYKKALKFLGAFDAELKLFMAGNHDLELDQRYWASHLGEDDEVEDHVKATDIVRGKLAAEAGATYLQEGTHCFTLSNGAAFTIYASPYSPAFCDWAFSYDNCEDRFNKSNEVDDGIESIAEDPIPSFPLVDIVMTHGPPKGILDMCSQGNVGCGKLLRALQRARPRMHCFGHIHEANGMRIIEWESEETGRLDQGIKHDSPFENRYPIATHVSIRYGQQSLLVNAAVMDEKNRPVNAPWLVDIELTNAATEDRLSRSGQS